MNEGVAQLEREVRELVRQRGVDPVAEPEVFGPLVAEAVQDYEERAFAGRVAPLPDSEVAAKAVADAVAGLGPLQQYLDDDRIEEIWINEPGRVFVARSGRPELTTLILSTASVRDLVERMLRTSGRRLDLSKPAI